MRARRLDGAGLGVLRRVLQRMDMIIKMSQNIALAAEGEMRQRGQPGPGAPVGRQEHGVGQARREAGAVAGKGLDVGACGLATGLNMS